MSGDLIQINARRNSKRKHCSARMLAMNLAKKNAKLMIAEPPPHPVIQSRVVCFSCGSKDGVEVSHLCTSHLTTVSQVSFGRDSMKNSDN